MFTFRGDAHKVYLQLKKETDPAKHHDLKETASIKAFYESIDSETLRLIHYRMIKEQNGLGIIPIYVTSIPWLLFLFSNKIEEVLFTNGNILWLIFVIIYLVLLTAFAFFHFKEKAWAAFHIEMIKDVLASREDRAQTKPER
ncbi:hypothetical protein JNUCC1_02093 [Lentibacillus sp. JNUCC-1]|uniref:hypothetical protein n=1 Tax=Lentibacillus sp. JNUCC-1 TaxID=2654513 RepID=UPI0012E89022|nr:hypothetical protein [Lentibacillus sp. JNUCC-1]MUV38257.1 hypothetical protein [Lentibacillus sp. JNUCC-1]